MKYVLFISAFVIAGLYCSYLCSILLGRPERFETRMVIMLATWMRSIGPASKKAMENIFALCVMAEITYFGLVFYVVTNPFLLVLSAGFALFETVHLVLTYRQWVKFFRGKVVIKNILLWPYERISCMTFVLHAILLIICLWPTL